MTKKDRNATSGIIPDIPGAICASGTGTREGYVVEARVRTVNVLRPVTLADGILTTEWRPVSFSKGNNAAGVPHNHDWGVFDSFHLPYESAMALAWTIVAQHRYEQTECRLVREERAYTFKDTRKGVVDIPPIDDDAWLRGLALVPSPEP